MINFYDRDKNNDRINSLAQALNNRSNKNVTITPFQPVGRTTQSNSENTGLGISNMLEGAGQLYGGLKEAGIIGNKPSDNYGFGSPVGSSINDYVMGNNASTGSALSDGINNQVLGNTASDSLISDSINSQVLGSSAGGFNGMPLIGNAIGGLQGLNNTGTWEGGVQGMFGVNPDDSDVMQGVNGTVNGAMTGLSMGGPVGAAIGALLGLGSSFIDDI